MKKKKNPFEIIGIIFCILIGLGIIMGAIITLFDSMSSNSNNNIKDDYKLSKLSYKLSGDFEVSDSYYDYSKYYSYSKDGVYCHINISYDEIDKYNNYDNGKDYLLDKVSIKLKDKYDGPSKLLINNKNWYKVVVDSYGEDVLYKKYYYSTKFKKKIYYIEYDISDYNNGDSDINNSICYNYVDEFSHSLKFN